MCFTLRLEVSDLKRQQAPVSLTGFGARWHVASSSRRNMFNTKKEAAGRDPRRLWVAHSLLSCHSFQKCQLSKDSQLNIE